MVLWFRDFEARRSQGAAVEQATRIDALGRLTGGVAHDFNNLLTVIQGNTEILSRRLQGAAANPAQAERPLAAIRAATDRAAKLTRQLLVFARGGPAEPMSVDLGRKVIDLSGAISQLVGSGVAVETDLEPVPPVGVDPLQLEAALLNLAANARDAMGGAGLMRIRLRHEPSGVVLSIRDHGPGFDPSVLSRVFDPFFTTKPVGQGTGLGLSQVYGLVKGAGGEVRAGNAPGGGGVVTLTFPPAQAPAETAPAEPPGPVPAPAGPGMAAVLLVDDNDAVRATTAAYLRECGLSIIEAPDAAHAMQALETSRVEAVVSDIINGPGRWTAWAWRRPSRAAGPSCRSCWCPVSASARPRPRPGGSPCWAKPYSLPELETRLRRMVDRIQATQAKAGGGVSSPA